MAKDITKEFPVGVSWYTEGHISLPIYFPEDKVSCNYCQFCRREENLGRFWCRLTNEMIYNPYAGVGESCPITINEKGKEGK